MRRKGPAYKNNPLILFAPAAKAMNCLVTNYCVRVVHFGLQHVKLRSGHIVRCAHDTVVFLLNVPLLLSHKMFCSVGLSFSRGKIMFRTRKFRSSNFALFQTDLYQHNDEDKLC